ncbi:hypothetical protein ACQRBI_07245 [Lactobacillus johnsonii]
MKEIDKYQELKQKLIENSNPDLAKQMEKYLRNKFKADCKMKLDTSA